jgi:hypothetical protein
VPMMAITTSSSTRVKPSRFFEIVMRFLHPSKGIERKETMKKRRTASKLSRADRDHAPTPHVLADPADDRLTAEMAKRIKKLFFQGWFRGMFPTDSRFEF